MIKAEKHRFVILIDKDSYEKFRELAEEQNRSASNLGAIVIKDYIKKPKLNGYRSYHMIIEIPVFFSDRKQKIRVEVQIRTIAMDFWASLDHQMKYKKNLDDSGEISEELKECAEVIAQTDMRMLNIRRKIEEKECPDKLLRFDRD